MLNITKKLLCTIFLIIFIYACAVKTHVREDGEPEFEVSISAADILWLVEQIKDKNQRSLPTLNTLSKNGESLMILTHPESGGNITINDDDSIDIVLSTKLLLALAGEIEKQKLPKAKIETFDGKILLIKTFRESKHQELK